MVLRDPSFHQQVRRIVEEKRVNVESAITEVIDSFTRAFEKIADPYLRERAADIRDVGRRVLATLAEGSGRDCVDVPEGAVVVSEELLPSATAHLELQPRARPSSPSGGASSRTPPSWPARWAPPRWRALPRPPPAIKTGDQVIVDGIAGLVYVNPNAARAGRVRPPGVGGARTTGRSCAS